MKASTFQTLIIGLLCLAVAGLSGGLYNQYQHLAELQSTNTQSQQTLDTLQRDSNALKDTQEKLQYALKDLKQMVDTGEQQANTLDPMLDQWAQEIQELRDGLTARATAADMTALRARLEQVEQAPGAQDPAINSTIDVFHGQAETDRSPQTHLALAAVFSVECRVPRG